MVKKVLSVFILMSLLIFASQALADSINYTSSTYQTIVLVGASINSDIRTSPPVSVSTVSGTVTGFSSIPDVTSMESNSEVLSVASGVFSGTSIMDARLRFNATFPQISIKFDYGVVVIADSGNFGLANASAGVYSGLYDLTAAASVWQLDVIRSVSVITGGDEYDLEIATGSVDILRDLVAGHNYELMMGTDFFHAAYAYAEGTGEASAGNWFKNIQISAVPLPGAWLFLSSGLVGLIGLRRLRRR